MAAAPKRFAVALFNGFQTLDVFGPIDILNFLSASVPLELSMLSATMAPVSSLHNASAGRIGQTVLPTHTYDNAPEDIEVLLVPGGMGTRDLDNTKPVRDFIQARCPKLRYLLTVCTGSAIAAQAGVLDGRRATTNKDSFSWVVSLGPKVNWVREARWVDDGNVWTSSGVSAGMDMTLAFVESQYGSELADQIAARSEYVWNRDPTVDPFAKYAK